MRTTSTHSGYCIECFTGISWSPRARYARCNNCQAKIVLKDLEPVLEFVNDAVTDGYLYPTIYKRDGLKGVKRRYSLIIDPILVWLALAAIGGIVGGLSYELVKAAMRKIRGRKTRIPIFSRGKVDLSTETIMLGYEWEITLTLSEEELKSLISGVRKHYLESQDVPRLRRRKKELIENHIDVLERHGEKISKAEKREFKKRLAEDWYKDFDVPPVLPPEIIQKIGKSLKERKKT